MGFRTTKQYEVAQQSCNTKTAQIAQIPGFLPGQVTPPLPPAAGAGVARGLAPVSAGVPVAEGKGIPAVADEASSPQRPDPQVLERPVRRRFDRDYKLRILQEADACSGPGQIGSLLRREGLYSSHLAAWRRQRTAGLAPQRRGRKPQAADPLVEENRRLRRENEQLTARLKQAETIIEVQKKVSEILSIPQHPPATSGSND